MLMPKRVKWRKQHRGVLRGNATRANAEEVARRLQELKWQV